MEQWKNNKTFKSRHIAYQNGGLTITYEFGSTPIKEKEYSQEVTRNDKVFYVETRSDWRYTKEDAIEMVRLLLNNMVYRGEQERFKKMLKEELGLCKGCEF